MSQIGIFKPHRFADGKDVLNLSLFSDVVETIEPINGRFSVFVNPSDNTIKLSESKDSTIKLSLRSDAFTPNLPTSAVENKGYYNFTCVKGVKDNKEFYSVYQSREKVSPLYVGSGFDLNSLNKKNDCAGPVFYNDKKYPYFTALINKADIDSMPEKFFINVKPDTFIASKTNSEFYLFDLNKSSDSDSKFIIHVSKSDILTNSLDTSNYIKINFAERNPDSVAKNPIKADYAVYLFNENKKTYVGNAWSNKQFNSLEPQLKNKIEPVKINNLPNINDIVSFPLDNDFFVKQISNDKNFLGYGIVTELPSDNSNLFKIHSPAGNFNLSADALKVSSKLHYMNFDSFYVNLKQDVTHQIQLSKEYIDKKKLSPEPKTLDSLKPSKNKPSKNNELSI